MYDKNIEESLKLTNSKKSGLSQEQVTQRQADGENVLPQKKQKSKILRFLQQFCDIMIIILLVASIISITIAIVEKSYSEMIDGFIILAIVFINAVLGFVQEIKAEKDMKALLKISEPLCKVKRDGQILKIQSRHLVVGDIIVLEAGDIIPADLRLIESVNLKCDESSLTGESVPVLKDCDFVGNVNTPLADRKNMAFKGCVVTLGRGIGVVTSIGANTELGKIATILNETEKDETPLQKNIKAIGKVITIIVLSIAVLTFVLELVFKPNGSIITAFLTAVAISVAAIPESLPAVITIIMSMGVSRLSKKKAIVKRLHAVETLGSTQIICSDKTGTLTQNVMTVRSLFFSNKLQKAQIYSGKDFDMLCKAMVLCNDSTYSNGNYVGDPTETALTEFCHPYLNKTQSIQQFERIDEIPFDSNRKLMTTLNKVDDEFIAFTKGAPDIILQKCNKILLNGEVLALNEELKSQILTANKDMGDKALRVLGCAYKTVSQTQTLNEENLIFIGLVGMIDPPRKEVFEAVEKCKKAHMTPIMITGDHSITAFSIAKEIGIAQDMSQVMTGTQLDQLSDEEYLKIINNIKVYARVSPENKVRIVKTFKQLGKVVAMTGDGVNDAPSLKSADIGVGMGITGTDVTKEVADLIVTDDNFATIIVAVEEGRRIYSNIKKTVGFLFAANLAEILSLFLATIIFPNLTYLLPVQILFVNLITDSMPAIALGMEFADSNIMTRHPRKSKETVFSNGIGLQIAIMGVVQTICVLGIFAIGYYCFGGNVVATSMCFYALNLLQLVYLLSIRTNDFILKSNPFKNKWILYSLLFGLGILAIFAFTPVGQILGLVTVTWVEWLIIIAFNVAMTIISEITKLIIRKKYKN